MLMRGQRACAVDPYRVVPALITEILDEAHLEWDDSVEFVLLAGR